VSLNRWVFKWRLKVTMLLHSRISAGREFHVDGAATAKSRRVSSVCMGLYQLAEVCWSGCGLYLVSQYSHL